MRVLQDGCAAVATAVSFLFTIPLLAHLLLQYGWPAWLAWSVAALVAVVASGFVAALLSPRGRFEPAPTLAELIAQGLVDSASFRASRAVRIRAWEDEGSHYLLQLEGAGVLYISGQFLWDYEPLEGDEALPEQPRRFPCTMFEVHRHKLKRYVVELECGGEVLEPEKTLPPVEIERVRAVLGIDVDDWSELWLRDDLTLDEVLEAERPPKWDGSPTTF